VLLDENMPKVLVRLLSPEAQARTVQQQGWSGTKNGALLALVETAFDVFITMDRGIPHQQNLDAYAIALLEARSNRAADIAPLVPAIKQHLPAASPGTLVRFAVA
jgi:hypothetical protein